MEGWEIVQVAASLTMKFLNCIHQALPTVRMLLLEVGNYGLGESREISSEHHCEVCSQ
jgi:hypothetical protein